MSNIFGLNFKFLKNVEVMYHGITLQPAARTKSFFLVFFEQSTTSFCCLHLKYPIQKRSMVTVGVPIGFRHGWANVVSVACEHASWQSHSF